MSDESVRAAERKQNERPDAGSVSRLAFELARSGRHDEAFRAAMTAAAQDADAAARELLVPTWTHESGERLFRAVPWAGLRKFGRARSLDAPGHRIAHHETFVELGRGLVAYCSADELLAVDIFSGRVLWRRARLQPLGLLDGMLLATSVSEDRTLALERIAVNTGTPTEPCRRLGCPGVEQRRGVTGERNVASFRLGSDRLVVKNILHEAVDHAGRRDLFGSDRVALTTFDLRSGSILARFETEQQVMRGGCLSAGDRIIVSGCSRGDGVGCTAFDIDGRELWTVDEIPLEGVVDSQLLCAGDEPNESRRIVDVRTGTVRTQDRVFANGSLECLANDVFITSHQCSFSGFDRQTLEQLWDGCNGEYSSAPTPFRRHVSAHAVVATRDSVVLVDSSSEGHFGLASVEPRTGEELSRLSLREHYQGREGGDRGNLVGALIAGHLVVGTTRTVEAPLLVVESAD